jgi:hypothetical protein
MDYVKDKVNQASETLQGKGAEASAEQNKRKPILEVHLYSFLTD